jgi:methanogenic corrinoid protein MtbC1
MIGCTLEGGLHELGIRMVSDFFEMEGWDTCYLGAHMPVTNIIRAVKEQQAHLLALSITMPNHITKLETLIQKIKGDETLVTLKIIVGGLPFIQYPGLWKCVGADGWAKNAREAVMLGTEMILHKNKPYEQTYPG